MDLGSEEKSFSPCYSLGSSFLLHLWFRPLSLISHPGALELPNQGQNLSCGFIPAGPVNERAVSLEDKIRVLKRSIQLAQGKTHTSYSNKFWKYSLLKLFSMHWQELHLDPPQMFIKALNNVFRSILVSKLVS